MYNFGDIYGNGQIKAYLRSSIANNKINQAYIITGGEGCGKTLLANAFAKAILCETGEACGGCVSCKTFDTGNNPDVLYISPTVKTGKTGTISVDDIRDLVCAPLGVKPFLHRYKVFIIKDGDEMNSSAQNALLKALEEPPDYGFFLITAVNYASFLPTIISRAITLKIKPLPDSAVAAYLTEKAGFTESEAKTAAAFAQGSIGRAVTLKNDAEFSALMFFAEQIIAGRYASIVEVIAAAKEFETHRARIDDLFDLLCLIYRDIIIYKACGGDDKKIIWKQNLKFIKDIAAKTSAPELHKRFDAVIKTIEVISKNANFTMAVEVMLLDLA